MPKMMWLFYLWGISFFFLFAKYMQNELMENKLSFVSQPFNVCSLCLELVLPFLGFSVGCIHLPPSPYPLM